MKLSTPKFDRDAVERIRVEASFGLVVGLWPVHMVVFFLSSFCECVSFLGPPQRITTNPVPLKLFLGLLRRFSHLCLSCHMALFPCVFACVLASSHEATVIGLRAHSHPGWPHLNVLHLKDPMSTQGHVLRFQVTWILCVCWGWGQRHYSPYSMDKPQGFQKCGL